MKINFCLTGHFTFIFAHFYLHFLIILPILHIETEFVAQICFVLVSNLYSAYLLVCKTLLGQ